jgi:LmbE family N-acetylglucosaminyl deacetylase
MLLFEADEPDHVEDVTGFAEAKIDALLCHQSQFQSTMGSDDDPELETFRDRVRDKLASSGRAGGVELAEVFKLIDDL